MVFKYFEILLCYFKRYFVESMSDTAFSIHIFLETILLRITDEFGDLFHIFFIMIFGDSEFKKKDIPYLIATALLLVPFAYTYLPDVDYYGFYNEMNTAILVDGLLYLAIILYYIVTEMITVIRRLTSNASKTQPA